MPIFVAMTAKTVPTIVQQSFCDTSQLISILSFPTFVLSALTTLLYTFNPYFCLRYFSYLPHILNYLTFVRLLMDLLQDDGDLGFESSFFWVYAISTTVERACTRLSELWRAQTLQLSRPRIRWWFRYFPAPTLQLLSSVIRVFFRSIFMVMWAAFYLFSMMDSINTYSMYMFFGANTVAASTNFIGDLFAFWGLSSTVLLAFVEWFHRAASVDLPFSSYIEGAKSLLRFMFLNKLYLIVQGSGATCITDESKNVTCTFRNETLLHTMADQLTETGFSKAASSGIASAGFLILVVGAAFVTISIYCFSIVNIILSYSRNGEDIISTVSDMWNGWSKVA